ncbi:putative phage abortive infection protein [Pseudomonas wadenswilerensis]
MEENPKKTINKKPGENLEDLWGMMSFTELEQIKLYWKNKIHWLRKNLIFFLALAAVVPIFFVAGAVVWHFQIGGNIPLIEIRNANTAAYWGQIGDFIGGVLNPLLSFAALIAVLYSLRTQSKELSLAREDARENQQIQAQQSLIFERQNFESVFFRLLDIHSKLASETIIEFTEYEFNDKAKNTDSYKGIAGFSKIEETHFPTGRYYKLPKEYETALSQQSKAMHLNFQNQLCHYFRNLYQIMKHIDSFGMDSLRLSKPSSRANIRAWIENYQTQRKYANMLRAQLSKCELSIIFLNCIGPQGKGLKYYVERFSLLKHMNIEIFQPHITSIYDLYDEIAFNGMEKIDNSTLKKHISKKLQAEPSHTRQIAS